MPFFRTRQRNNIPFEKLMVEPNQVNAFYGVESTEENVDSDSQISSQNETSSQDKRESTTNYDFHVSDNEVWRTMVTSGCNTPIDNQQDYDRLTPNYVEERRESETNYNFHVTDGPLWRTMGASANNTGYGCYASGASTPNYVEERRESETNYNFHVSDNPLWRTQVDENQPVNLRTNPHTPNYVDERRGSETNYNFQVTDNSLWRTTDAVSRMNGQVTPNHMEQSRASATNYNFNVTDNELWRTLVTAGQNTPANESQIDDELTSRYDTYQSANNNEVNSNEANTQTMNDPNNKEEIQFSFNKSLHTAANTAVNTSQNDVSSLSTTPNRPTMSEKSFHFMAPTQASIFKSKDSGSVSSCHKSAERIVEKRSHLPKKSVEAFTQTTGHDFPNRRRTVLQMMHEKSPGLPRRSIFLPPSNINNFQRRITNLAPFFNRLSSGSEKSISERVSVGSSTSFAELPKESPPQSKIPLRSPCSLPSTKRAPNSSPRLLDRVLLKEAYKSANRTPVSSKLPVSVSPKTPPTRNITRESSVSAASKTPPTRNITRESSVSVSPNMSTVSNDEEDEVSEARDQSEETISDHDVSGTREETISDHDGSEDNESVECDERPQIIQLSKALQQIGIDYKTPDPNQATSSKQPLNKENNFSVQTSTPTRSHIFNSLFGTKELKSGVIPTQHPPLNPNARPINLFELGDSLDESTGPCSQKILSQQPPVTRKPFTILNDDDFGSPAPRLKHKSSSDDKLIPNASRFYGSNDTTLNFGLEDTAGVSFISGTSDRDSDLDSPAPKHIILRGKQKAKSEPYMYVRPPKIVQGSDNQSQEQPTARRSKRTRFHRQLVCGEKPIYERDENGDYNIVGVSKGYTADPLCKKFNTFDKDTAMERQKQEKERKKRIREQNRAQHVELNEKYLD